MIPSNRTNNIHGYDDASESSNNRRHRSLSDASNDSSDGRTMTSEKYMPTSEVVYRMKNCQQVSDLYRECVARKFKDAKVCNAATSLYVACSYSDK